MWKSVSIACGMLLLGNCIAHAGASFSCAKARTPDEKAICDDPVLANIDGLVARAYAAFSSSFQPESQVARLLLADRRTCGSDRACIAAAQYSALQTYAYGLDAKDQPEPWVESYAAGLMGDKASALAQRSHALSSRLPRQIGECVVTRITSVTTRFGDPISYSNEDAGTAFAFENGGFEISYVRDGLDQAREGDRVVMCLMSIPRDCPDGDERGREYYTLDVTIRQQWILPDAQHLCGGA